MRTTIELPGGLRPGESRRAQRRLAAVLSKPYAIPAGAGPAESSQGSAIVGAPTASREGFLRGQIDGDVWLSVNVLLALIVRSTTNIMNQPCSGSKDWQPGLCRIVQLGLIRLLGNRWVMGKYCISASTAWGVIETRLSISLKRRLCMRLTGISLPFLSSIFN